MITLPTQLTQFSNDVLHDLVKMPNTLSKWFTHNLLKVNPEKSHLLTNSAQEIQVYIDRRVISNSKCEKLLGIHIDNKFTFKPHVRSIRKKASQKLNPFARIACSLKFDERKLLLNVFITSQLSHAPVVWMFHNRKLDNHINRIHERTLRIVYQDIIQRSKNFMRKTVRSKSMTVICRDYSLKYLKLKWSLIPKS